VVEPELVKQYVDTGKVKLVWHDFAWIGEESRQAAQAARCAGRQGKFWEYHDHLYHNQRGENRGQFAPPNLKQFAADLELDTATFSSCLDSTPDLVAIQQELTTARQQGINATPVFVLNGQRLAGARSLEQFAQAIDAELAKSGR
jgi:protein-disulfide isomerase